MKSKENGHISLARKRELIVKELTDEVLVYDLSDNKAHCLNQTAAFVWKHCDGETTVPEIAAMMEEEWKKPVGEETVWLALKQLSRAKLLEEPVTATGESMRASRRAVLRKLGAAAALTPMVISLVAPTASAGASIPPACLTCSSFAGGRTCPPICNNVLGCCFNNASCNTGQGGFLGQVTCLACQQNSGGLCPNSPPQSIPSGWRATVDNTCPACPV
ncbi:MAG TPA: PqqD family protein [Blastocatellia bacterium]|nr:PqqD family protein [Blastocatellia bacterium]